MARRLSTSELLATLSSLHGHKLFLLIYESITMRMFASAIDLLSANIFTHKSLFLRTRENTRRELENFSACTKPPGKLIQFAKCLINTWNFRRLIRSLNFPTQLFSVRRKKRASDKFAVKTIRAYFITELDALRHINVNNLSLHWSSAGALWGGGAPRFTELMCALHFYSVIYGFCTCYFH